VDNETCYKAVLARDKRFDGRFFTAVHTTGIYCRPVCPAPAPKRENVTFFSCAAAAEAEGFRPCYRCRPEASPGTPAWVGTSATVARALRLIGEGYLDTAGVDELAEQLGVGSRHLRRLFVEHLGASPNAVALTRRVHFAKVLLEQTAMPITEIAFSAGFASVRRFNDAFHKTFHKAPTDVRRFSGDEGAAATNGHITLRVPYRPPFDWANVLLFLGARAIPGIEEVVDQTYKRAVRIGDATGVIEVSHNLDACHLSLRVPTDLNRHASEIVLGVRRLFDLNADPSAIATHLAEDALLAPIIRRFPGSRVPGAWDPFETAVRAVVGQQVTVRGATTIAGAWSRPMRTM